MNKKFRIYQLINTHLDDGLRRVSYQKPNGYFYTVEDFKSLEEAEDFLKIREEKMDWQDEYVVLPVYQLEMD